MIGLLTAMVTGCFTVPENKDDAAVVAGFSGNPNIDGRYWNEGQFRSYGGEWVAGSLSYVLREPEPHQLNAGDIDLVAISHKDGALVFDFITNGSVRYSMRFLPGADYSSSDKEIVIKRKVMDPGGDEGTAEIHMALDSERKLRVVVHEQLVSYTGVAIPIVPFHHTDTLQYVFSPIGL